MSVTKPLTWNCCGPGIHSASQGHCVKTTINLLQKPFASRTWHQGPCIVTATRQRRRRCAHEVCGDSDGYGLYRIRQWTFGFGPDVGRGTEKANAGRRRRQAKFARAARQQDGFHPCCENKSARQARDQAGHRRRDIAQAPQMRGGRLCRERFAAAQIANQRRKPPISSFPER